MLGSLRYRLPALFLLGGRLLATWKLHHFQSYTRSQ